MTTYVRYRDDLETVPADEPATIEALRALMTKAQHLGREKHGESVRSSHAKAHAFVRGSLIVADGLPPELAQGLFAMPRTYEVLARMSQVPGEVNDDRAVSSPRGFAVKVFGVEGPMLPGHEGAATQDFVFDTSKVFPNANAKTFLAGFTPPNLIAPRLPDVVKSAVTHASEAVNDALHAVGSDSPTLDVYGHPAYHPLGEAYYSQMPLRYGDYVAKLAFIPANPALAALYREVVDRNDANVLRNVARAFFARHPAVYDVRVQLMVDEATTPIEDATVEWPEDASPYRTVAQLVLPPQESWDRALQDFVDHELSFAPAHAMAAHRPLGSIGRARLGVYPYMAEKRRRENGRVGREPASLAEVKELVEANRPSAPIRGTTQDAVRRSPRNSGKSALPWLLAGAGLVAGIALFLRYRDG